MVSDCAKRESQSRRGARKKVGVLFCEAENVIYFKSAVRRRRWWWMRTKEKLGKSE
jgi:hypothetical protein